MGLPAPSCVFNPPSPEDHDLGLPSHACETRKNKSNGQLNVFFGAIGGCLLYQAVADGSNGRL